MYMLVLGTYVALSVYWGNGPKWPFETGMEPFCKDSWWTNLLYINNLVKTTEQVHFNDIDVLEYFLLCWTSIIP